VLNAVVKKELKEEDLNEIYKLAVKYVLFIVIVDEVASKIKEFMRQVHLEATCHNFRALMNCIKRLENEKKRIN
jgi:hypothetical protein